MRPTGQGDSLPIQKISKRTCGLAVVIVALDLHSYYARELLVSMALFSVAFLFLAVLVFAALLLWWASEQLVDKSGPTSRRVIAFSRRLIAAYAKP
jgi:hypothetical protein